MVIDESKYLMKLVEILQFLDTVFRHHRHHDLSIRLVTQTVNEFFQHEESEIILDQCAVKQFHHLDGMDEEWASEFGLNHAQMKFVQKAIPGEEEAGFSQALVGVDGEWRGVEVRAMEKEQQVIDFQPIEQSHEELPGSTQTEPLDPEVEAFREQLEEDISREYAEETKATASDAELPRTDGGDGGGAAADNDGNEATHAGDEHDSEVTTTDD
jgi:type IV secretory pathway VirB4 component